MFRKSSSCMHPPFDVLTCTPSIGYIAKYLHAQHSCRRAGADNQCMFFTLISLELLREILLKLLFYLKFAPLQPPLKS